VVGTVPLRDTAGICATSIASALRRESRLLWLLALVVQEALGRLVPEEMQVLVGEVRLSNEARLRSSLRLAILRQQEILALAETADKTKLAVQTMAVVVLEPVDTLGMAELVGRLDLPTLQLAEAAEAQVAEGLLSFNQTFQTHLTNYVQEEPVAVALASLAQGLMELLVEATILRLVESVDRLGHRGQPVQGQPQVRRA